MSNRPTAPNRLAPALGLAVLLAVLWVVLGLTAPSASGVAAKQIGEGGATPKPGCPAPEEEGFPSYEECNAFGHVTGFQISTDNERAVFKARESGRIVAWSVDTGLPQDDPYRNFFEQNLSDETFDRYGGTPTAGISILKEVGRGRFKLTKKSPIVELDGSLGRSPIFTLKKPLRIQKGRVVALTTPTWVTNFALATPRGDAALSGSYQWRASRKPDRCEATPEDNSNLTDLSHPHVEKGTTKKYGCVYPGADILYRAYYVPDAS